MLKDHYILRQVHPTLPLSIYNYSQDATFDNVWNHETMTCRGLIVDREDNVIARPFRKFFNLNDIRQPGTMEANLPNTIPIVTEKMDGSLGIYWIYRGYEDIATRGSFTSEQSQWATRYLKNYWSTKFYTIACDGFTPVFEIIYHENRIVVDYDFEGLILLSVIRNSDGSEIARPELVEMFKGTGFPLVQEFNKSLAQIVSENVKNSEGYVLCWPGKTPGIPHRVKAKFPDYMRLHKLITGVSPKSLHRMLMEGHDPISAMGEGLPSTFVEWMEHWTKLFHDEYDRILKSSTDIYEDLKWKGSYYTRKQIAEEFLKHLEFKSVLFLMLDKRPVEEQVWKQVWQNIRQKIKEDDVFKKDIDQ
jgi:RNA ligase